MSLEEFKSMCKEMGTHLRAIQQIVTDNRLENSIMISVSEDCLIVTHGEKDKWMDATSFETDEFRCREFPRRA